MIRAGRTFGCVAALASLAGACGAREFDNPGDPANGPTAVVAAPIAVEIDEPRPLATVTTPTVTASGRFSPTALTDAVEIWVIVWPELAGGKAYPQSPQASLGTAATIDQANQRWSTPISLGGPDQTYRVSVHTGDMSASRALRETLIAWATSGNFAGLLRDQLPQPPALEERQSITIVKREPPSSVRIVDPADGARPTASGIVVRGTYSPQTLVDARTIWVLVWPAQADGKAYPQSPNAGVGEPATVIRASQTWSVPAGLGGPPQSYRISVHTADADASRVLGGILRDWTARNEFPGLRPEQLPSGLEERHSILVTRLN